MIPLQAINQTPIESLFLGSIGVWDRLKTSKLEQQLHIRREAIKELNQNKKYEPLTRLLLDGHERLLLYLPSFLIPEHTEYRQNEDTDNYIEAIISSFNTLLNSYEPRSNFTNGDYYFQQVVSPAAMVSRILVSKGLLSNNWIKDCYDSRWYDYDVIYNSYHDDLTTTLPEDNDCERTKWITKEKRRLQLCHRNEEAIRLTKKLGDLRSLDVDIAMVAIGDAIRDCVCNKELINKIITKYDGYIQRALDNEQYRGVAYNTLSGLIINNILDTTILSKYQISIPTLCGVLSNNLISHLAEIDKIYKQILNDDELQFLYPVITLSGSRLKGYGSNFSDVDVAVFVKDGIDFGRAMGLIESKINGAMVYFLKEESDRLIINDHGCIQHVAAPYDIHMLFNGAWVGNETTVGDLCSKLLVPITQSSAELRSLFTIDIERSLLQYRLLHRGYQEFNRVDGPVFFDDGYRTMASELYLRYVFLP